MEIYGTIYIVEIINTLTDLGFDVEEARVYESVLLLGSATITEIARRANLKRPSVYNYTENLLRQNLLTREICGKRQLYIAHDPNKLLVDLTAKRENLKKNLPALTALYASTRKRPSVTYFENKQEIRQAYNDIAQNIAPIYSIFSVQDFLTIFSHTDLKRLNTEVKANNTPIYDLIEDNKVGQQYLKTNRSNGHKIRTLPKNFTFTTDTLVTNNTVFLVSFKNMMGIKIENQDIADFFRNTFKLIWDTRKH